MSPTKVSHHLFLPNGLSSSCKTASDWVHGPVALPTSKENCHKIACPQVIFTSLWNCCEALSQSLVAHRRTIQCSLHRAEVLLYYAPRSRYLLSAPDGKLCFLNVPVFGLLDGSSTPSTICGLCLPRSECLSLLPMILFLSQSRTEAVVVLCIILQVVRVLMENTAVRGHASSLVQHATHIMSLLLLPQMRLRPLHFRSLQSGTRFQLRRQTLHLRRY